MCSVLLQVIALYIAELSPKHLRGKLVSLVSGGGNLGVIVSLLTDSCMLLKYIIGTLRWQILFLIIGLSTIKH